MLSRKEFEELIVSDQVQNVTVIQNKNVPTGRVEIELEAEEGERGEVKNYYVSDVNRIQEDLAEWDVDYELPNAPQDNWFTTTILPVLLMMAGVFFLFSMMNRQGGGANAKAMSFGKSRAKLSTEKDKKITFAQVAGLKEEKEELEEEERRRWEDMTLEEHMDLYLNQGTEKKEAMKKVAKDRGIRKRDVYQALLKD